MISKMLKMQMLEDEDDLAYAETEKKARTDSTSDGRPAWMRTLHTTASNWLHLIPQTLSPLKRTVENIKDPLFRFFEREVKMGAKLLQDVRQDLADVVQVCEGKKKQTNYLRTLINELVKGADRHAAAGLTQSPDHCLCCHPPSTPHVHAQATHVFSGFLSSGRILVGCLWFSQSFCAVPVTF